MSRVRTLAPLLLLWAVPAPASTPAADAAVAAKSAAACIKASGLRQPRVGPVVRFSDDAGVDVRTVTGLWPQPHMRGSPPARMLCLYNRRTTRVEVQEQPMGEGRRG